MKNPSTEALIATVLDFAMLVGPLTEEQLQSPWTWGSYEGEGVRFGTFRVYEELLTLAERLGAARTSPLTEAQRILGQYHRAYRDLQGALWGVDDQTAVMQPGEDEWPVQITLAHLVQADLGFYAVLAYASERHTAGETSPGPPQDADYDRILDATEDDFDAIKQMPVSKLQLELLNYHKRALDTFAGIKDEMLDLPSRYWEDEAYPIRFRLHRFGSHMRQHTIQIDHTLLTIGKGPDQAKSLVRLILNALADVENQVLWDEDAGSDFVAETVGKIETLTVDIRQALGTL
jgi:hypothetical protein